MSVTADGIEDKVNPLLTQWICFRLMLLFLLWQKYREKHLFRMGVGLVSFCIYHFHVYRDFHFTLL